MIEILLVRTNVRGKKVLCFNKNILRKTIGWSTTTLNRVTELVQDNKLLLEKRRMLLAFIVFLCLDFYSPASTSSDRAILYYKEYHELTE